jgi:WD40 repeat protein
LRFGFYSLARSAGEDGFAEIWNNQSALERYQLSPYGIKSMVLSPEKPQIAVIESDGFESCRVSAWDYKHKKNLFTLSFQDSVSYINYSAAGSFLIAVRNKRRKLSLSDILCKWNR